MKPKTLIMMGVAIVCGLAASYLTSRIVAKNQEKVVVLVAKEKMGQWTIIKSADERFAEKEILVNDAPKSAILAAQKAEVNNRTVRRNLEENDVLTNEDLLPKDKNSLESQITPGKRAWAVKITQDSSAGGFVLPGSHVDVWHIGREGSRGPEARLILENVLVRAVGMLPVRPEDRPGILDATATLELSPDEIEDLAKVQDSGMLRLSLRPSGDQSTPGKERKEKVEAKGPDVAPPPPQPEGEKTETVKTDEKTEATPKVEVKDPETVTKVMTVYNGQNWIQRVYVLDKKTGEIISSEVRQSDTPRVEPKPEAKPAADKAEKPEEKSTN